MASKKSINLLPGIFQTETNRKFLSATIDQLISDPNLINVNGYIGRKFAPTYKINDSYVLEPNSDRQNYQLEPSVVVRGSDNQVNFFAGYTDLLNKIKYYGGFINNHDRLFNNEFYSYDPGISYDKFINFSQYFWLQDGPDSVEVSTGSVSSSGDFTVVRNIGSNRYDFIKDDKINNTLILARGGRYTFKVDQPGASLWIQTERGIDGKLNAVPTLSSREVLGVDNNGEDVGTITFNVPFKSEQEWYVSMPTVFEVDYAAPLAYADLHNQLLSVFLSKFPQYAGITGQLDGKYLIFINEYLHTSRGEDAWTAKGVYDLDGFQINTYDEGNVIPLSQRYGVWKVVFADSGIPNDPIVRLVWTQNVNFEEKVFVKYGLVNANKEFYKAETGFFREVPLLSALLDELWIQDSVQNDIYTRVKIVDPINSTIDVENDIIGKQTYTSPNGIEFTSGLKIRFAEDVIPTKYQNTEYYVENVGDHINLVKVADLVTPEIYREELKNNYPDQVFPEYITIKRDALDGNAWSRNNRWFHIDIITKTAEYNNTTPIYDQDLRAKRPIVQFEGTFQLYQFGRQAVEPIDAIDANSIDPFNDYEGKVLDVAFGVPLVDGLRVIFAAARDPLVRGKIYTVNLVQYEASDLTGISEGPYHIKLTLASDGSTLEKYHTAVVKGGQFRGSSWWYDGANWQESQEKTSLQQEPLFDVFDINGKSLGDYTRSTFTGTKIFGYLKNSSGPNDSILGFPLKYRNFGTQGDIEFKNFFNTDTFSYEKDGVVYNSAIISESGFLHKIIDRETVKPKNIWVKVAEESKQYQVISYVYDDPNKFTLNSVEQTFKLDVAPKEDANIANLKVFVNNSFLTADKYTLSDKLLTIIPTLNVNDRIDVLVYSDEISKIGYYQVPSNLNLNAQNINLDTFTFGQIRNHLVELSQNSLDLDRPILGPNNLRDLEIKQQGGTILQHSAPVPYASIFLLDETVNFVNSVRLSQLEYSKFKNKFLELSTTLSGVDPTSPRNTVDLIINNINDIKNISFPWFYSDMVPYGSLVNTIQYTIFDPLIRSYEITNLFDDTVLSNKAVLVYRNGLQLVKDIDYTFDKDRPAVTFSAAVPLTVDDVIEIVEYQNTDGNFIPETPTKLGLYPKFVPEIFVDDTYRTPTLVIRGHDGSLTPAFNDYRDALLLELEKRIYNNLKLPENVSYDEIWSVMPSKFRDSGYSRVELAQLVSRSFLAWVGSNKIDFNTNDTFLSNDEFTWNYSKFIDRVDGESMPGSWRSCYLYYYDTIRPHIAPWEMLGFTIKPDWWEEVYGPAPYTGGNKFLWDDLEAGLIRFGSRKGVDTKFARSGLSKLIPVDDNGNLLPPSAIIAKSTQSKYASSSWAVGEIGPVEWAWRSSSDFPFALQIAMALSKPAKYFGSKSDVSRYRSNLDLDQYLTVHNNHHFKQVDLYVHGSTKNNTVVRTAGYINWIGDYLKNLGIDPKTKIDSLVQTFEVNLAYKMAGFTDKDYIRVLAEQSSPTSTNDSVLIPDENYNVHLFKSSPVQRAVYSAVIVEKTNSGFSVSGYNYSNPFFTIIPSVANNNAYKIKVLTREGVIFRDYRNYKLTVPYGYEFKNIQQVVDFLISYERFLMGQGFVFNDKDDDLVEIKNWKLSVKEFLFWAQQGWAPGSIIVLSPVSNSIKLFYKNAIVDKIDDTQYGTRILDHNFSLVRNTDYDVLRDSGEFKLTLAEPSATVGLVEVNLVQYEHVLIFDNITVFNDIIYKPELGNRQYRLKLIGQKTAEWDGSLYAPGFVFNNEKIQNWVQGNDYYRGELVVYKNQTFVALENIPGSDAFNYNYWKQINQNEIKTGLLPNFATIASSGEYNYDSYAYFKDENQLRYAHSLIGFKNRQYLSDLGLNDTTQIEFYKGYIKQKGTANAVNQLIKAEFNNLSSDITFFEEWAVRVGEYGALNINPYVEVPLDESEFSSNPSIAQFVLSADNSIGDGLKTFNNKQLYRSFGTYTSSIALNRDDTSYYEGDIPTAGYVHLDDVDVAIFDLNDYTQLNDKIEDIGTGYTIWVAKDFEQRWNVYRISETNNVVVSIENAMDGLVTVVFEKQHGFAAGNVFLIRYFDDNIDGFYQIQSVTDTYKVIVKFNGSSDYYSTLTTATGNGIVLKLDSMRFRYMEDARVYGLSNPLNYWKEGDKIWIDDDAAVSKVQGQPYDLPGHTWKVYEKSMPWKDVQKISNDVEEDNEFGHAVKISADGLFAVVGSPGANAQILGSTYNSGKIVTFNKSENPETGELIFRLGDEVVPPVLSNVSMQTKELGRSVDLSVEYLAGGAPGSINNVGMVYVYHRPQGTAKFNTHQVLYGNLSEQGRFGASITFDEFGDWLYVGAPNVDKVYVYGLNKNVKPIDQLVSVTDKTVVTLSNVITANVGDTLRQQWANSSTGFSYTIEATVLANVVASNTVTVRDSIGLQTGVSTGNTTIGNIQIIPLVDPFHTPVNTSVYVTTVSRTSITNSFTLDFTPDLSSTNVAAAASSLLISYAGRTFVPGLDYTVSGNVVSFTGGNLFAGEYTVSQRPYYQLLDILNCPTGTGKEFGYSLDASLDGAQLAVGTPNDTVNVAVKSDGTKVSVPVGSPTSGLVSYKEYVGAGSVYVYDRIIEAFKSTGEKNYTTTHTIPLVRKVTIDGEEVTNYTVVGTSTISFDNPPPIGKIIYVETNKFNLLEKLIGIDSLEGGLDAIQANTRFGTDLTICSNNCAIYVGAPNYSAGQKYNIGAVWKFHHRGRLYGTNNGYTVNPVFAPNDTIRLDNFEVKVSLRLSGNIIASQGSFITQASTGANVTVLQSTANGGEAVIKISDYKNGNVFTLGSGVVSVNGVPTTVYPVYSTLDDFINDINSAGLLGISAVNENNTLRLISDSTVAKNLLRTLSGRNVSGNPNGVSNIYDEAGMAIFAFMQIIVTPYSNSGEHFGNRVVLARNAYMLVISSDRGTTRSLTSFDDNSTTLDDGSTEVFDSVLGSGSVYIYELYDDPRNEVEHPGRYAFAQQLNPGDLNFGDKFGTDIDISGGYIITSAPGDDTTGTNYGSVYFFHNPTLKRGWSLIRYQEPKVDIESINRLFLYDKLTNTIITNIEFIDPNKGKILGLAEQEITYKTAYDPAFYNKGNGTRGNVNENIYWGPAQVGQVWWNLDKIRFIEYEQGSLAYRGINWGRTFPGSVVEVAEWIESSVPPSLHVDFGFEGTPLYPDDSAYVEVMYVDQISNIISSRYYYWVVDRTSVDKTNATRRLPLATIKDFIENPKAQNVPYAAILRKDAIAFFNISDYLSAANTILHVDYEVQKNNSIIHSEYECITAGNPDSIIPEKISQKLIDSLAGQDAIGRTVPDPFLSPYDQYGISFRPRQSMFVNRNLALKNLVSYVNEILIKSPIVREFDLPNFLAEEPQPDSQDYDIALATEQEMEYIDVMGVPVGYTVLVENDTTQQGLWTMYELSSQRTWQIVKTQSYKTSQYWDYVDWYAEGFNANEVIEYVVETLVDALKIPASPGDEILVKVNKGPVTSGWNLLTVDPNGNYRVVGIENGTIQLKSIIYDYSENFLGFGNQGFSEDRYDQNPGVEIRNIIKGLKEDIFIRTLEGKFNELFFVMVNYLFTEQKYVDWIFKTSFISVTHRLRALTQYPNYVRDNQTYYLDYINEVKPYATKVREYTVNYQGDDEFVGDVTDFDLPPYYDIATGIFRSPSGEQGDKDRQMWATGYLNDQLINIDYPSWYQNKNYVIGEIIIENPGSGYLSEPTVEIVGGGTVTERATATAKIDFDTGQVISIDIVNPGQGYSITPTVIVNGGSTESARAYAVLKNQQVRSFDSAIKFDRISYTSSVKEWQPQTSYQETQIVNINGKEFWIGGDIVTVEFDERDQKVRRAYKVTANVTTGTTFNESLFEVYPAANFVSATDRIIGYYQPAAAMPDRDLAKLIYGIEYPGVEVTGVSFASQTGFAGHYTANITFSGNISVGVGNVITQPEADSLINLNHNVQLAAIGSYITQASSGANATVYGNTIVHGINLGQTLGVLGNVVNSSSIYLIKNNAYNFSNVGNIAINGVEQKISTYGNVITSNVSLSTYESKLRSGSLLLSDIVESTVVGNFIKYTTNIAPYVWSNIGITPIEVSIGGSSYTEIPISDATMTVTKVWDSNKVEGKINTTLDFVTGSSSLRGGLIKINGISQSVYPTEIQITSDKGASTFDGLVFDSLDIDESGNPKLNESNYDTLISSFYSDTSLGIRPEDIDVDGGKYVDTYSSHAPEELIPGIVFDTLDIKVFQSGPGDTINAFKIFSRNFQYTAAANSKTYFSETTYLRLCDEGSSQLEYPLEINSTEIFVADASVFPEPSPENSEPGVVWIGAERITYYERDLVNNTLGRIRRGTKGTAVKPLHKIGSIVVDGSKQQVIPGTTWANVAYGNGSNIYSNFTSTITGSMYNLSTPGTTDGTGLEGSTTDAGVFIKECSAKNILGLILTRAIETEDAVNTLSTESGDDLYEEDF